MCNQKLAGEPEVPSSGRLFPSISKGLTLTSSTENKQSNSGEKLLQQARESKHLGPAPAVSREVGLAMPRSQQCEGCHTPRGGTCHCPGMACLTAILVLIPTLLHTLRKRTVHQSLHQDSHWEMVLHCAFAVAGLETKWPALTGQWCTTSCLPPLPKKTKCLEAECV